VSARPLELHKSPLLTLQRFKSRADPNLLLRVHALRRDQLAARRTDRVVDHTDLLRAYIDLSFCQAPAAFIPERKRSRARMPDPEQRLQDDLTWATCGPSMRAYAQHRPHTNRAHAKDACGEVLAVPPHRSFAAWCPVSYLLLSSHMYLPLHLVIFCGKTSKASGIPAGSRRHGHSTDSRVSSRRFFHRAVLHPR